MGEVEDRPRALIEHIGVEALRAKQGNVALEPQPYGLKPGKLAFEHRLPPIKLGARLKAMVAGLEVVGEITGRAAGQKREDESREPHSKESAREPLSGGYRPRFSTARPA